MKVWNVGAVKHGRNSASRPASEHGAVGAGRHRRITLTRAVNERSTLPPHTQDLVNHSSPACPRDPRTSDSARNCETGGVWSHLKRGLGNCADTGIDQLVTLVTTRLKRIQYRPELLAGFLGQTGLVLQAVPP